MDRNTLYIYTYLNSINFAVARVSNLQQGQQQGTSTMFLLPHLRIMCDRETGAAGFFFFFFSPYIYYDYYSYCCAFSPLPLLARLRCITSAFAQLLLAWRRWVPDPSVALMMVAKRAIEAVAQG